jgi:hypothetical protein
MFQKHPGVHNFCQVFSCVKMWITFIRYMAALFQKIHPRDNRVYDNGVLYCNQQGRIQGGGAPGAHPPPPPKIGKNMIFWRKIVIFRTKYPKNFRASLRSAQFFLSAHPLTWNPGSAPDLCKLKAFIYLFS